MLFHAIHVELLGTTVNEKNTVVNGATACPAARLGALGGTTPKFHPETSGIRVPGTVFRLVDRYEQQ